MGINMIKRQPSGFLGNNLKISKAQRIYSFPPLIWMKANGAQQPDLNCQWSRHLFAKHLPVKFWRMAWGASEWALRKLTLGLWGGRAENVSQSVSMQPLREGRALVGWEGLGRLRTAGTEGNSVAERGELTGKWHLPRNLRTPQL